MCLILYSSNECICIIFKYNAILKRFSYMYCTVVFCSVERDTHRYFLLDRTNHQGTSKRSVSEIQEQSSNLASVVIDGTAVNVP